MKPIAIGALAGLVFYGAAVLIHGGVRAERGCVLDSPIYEIVNGPVMALHGLGAPLSPEGIGESPPIGMTISKPPFHAGAVIGLGLLFWMAIGTGIGAGMARIRRRVTA